MPNMPSLKVGDIVRVIRGPVTIGTRDYQNGDTLAVSRADGTYIEDGWLCARFELVAPKAATITKYRLRKNGGSFIVERRHDHYHAVTAGIPEAEARIICDALNAAEVA